MTIEKARKLLEQDGKSYSDNEVQELISTAEVLADLFIDEWIALSPEEKKKWRIDTTKRQIKPRNN